MATYPGLINLDHLTHALAFRILVHLFFLSIPMKGAVSRQKKVRKIMYVIGKATDGGGRITGPKWQS